MRKFIHKNSILNKNGNKFIVSCPNWAVEVLSPEDLAQFWTDWHEHLAYVNEKIEQRVVTQEMVYESVTIGGNTVKIFVGIKFTCPDDWVDHPKFVYWLQRMSQDPNLTFYGPEEIFE